MRQNLIVFALLLLFVSGNAFGQNVKPIIVPADAPKEALDTLRRIFPEGLKVEKPTGMDYPVWRFNAGRLQTVINEWMKSAQRCQTLEKELLETRAQRDSVGAKVDSLSDENRRKDDEISQLRGEIERQKKEIAGLKKLLSQQPPATAAKACEPKRWTPITRKYAGTVGLNWANRDLATLDQSVTIGQIGVSRLLQPRVNNASGRRQIDWWGNANLGVYLTTSAMEENGIQGVKTSKFLQSFHSEGGLNIPFRLLDDGVNIASFHLLAGAGARYDPVLEKAGVGPLFGATAMVQFGEDGCGKATQNHQFSLSFRGTPFGIAYHFESWILEAQFTSGNWTFKGTLGETRFSKDQTWAVSDGRGVRRIGDAVLTVGYLLR
jgi:hypothetical protein